MSSERRENLLRGRASWLGPALAVALIFLSGSMTTPVAQPKPAPPAQKRFQSPEEATEAVVAALRSGDTKGLLDILGSAGRPLVSSGDAVADRAAFERFVRAFDEAHRLERMGESKAILYVGKDDWPLPIPLVQDRGTWYFDTKEGKEEILNRRIGRNELSVIQVCLAYVDAQREYYEQAHDGSGILKYAQKFVSSPGKRDGLYWETKPGEPPSPLGPLVARARAAGYATPQSGAKPTPYYGYYYRILTSQGPDAPGGAYDYVARGHMIGGFALVAYPAEYGVSGVMTFIVSHDGVVYQKNLGPNTAAGAGSMKRFNPDRTWTKVEPVALASPGS